MIYPKNRVTFLKIIILIVIIHNKYIFHVSFHRNSEKPSLNDLKERGTISEACAIIESNLSEDVDADSCILDIKPLEESRNQKLPLTDITLSLDDIILSNDSEKVLLDEDNGLKITMNFTENKPYKNISVVVISITNKSKLPVSEVQLDASVKKV